MTLCVLDVDDRVFGQSLHGAVQDLDEPLIGAGRPARSLLTRSTPRSSIGKGYPKRISGRETRIAGRSSTVDGHDALSALLDKHSDPRERSTVPSRPRPSFAGQCGVGSDIEVGGGRGADGVGVGVGGSGVWPPSTTSPRSRVRRGRRRTVGQNPAPTKEPDAHPCLAPGPVARSWLAGRVGR